jgi:NADPH:quinone reductase-like Zn-dependent oxidoreductase
MAARHSERMIDGMSLPSSTEEMMALRAHSRGGPEVLVYERAPKPVPSATEALIAVDAASITFAELGWDETWERDGHSRLPIIPSHEVAGVIREVGSETQGWTPGDRVYGLIPFDLDGAAAEFVSVEASILAKAPISVSAVESAATPLAALTAWQGLLDHGELQAGQRVLIHGGGGGVGIFAVQLAHHFGAEVSVTARKADTDLLVGLGADHVIDFAATQFDALGQRYDVVFDAVGGDVLDRSFAVTRRGGRLITLMAPPSAERAAEFDVTATFFIVSPNPTQLASIARLIDDARLRVIVAATFPLAEGRRAFESGFEHGRAPGKTVLRVS